jgi:hypothetical protein
VDRRFSRRRYDAARTIAAFSGRLREQVDLDTLTAELLAVTDRTVEPTTVSLWLRPQAERLAPPVDAYASTFLVVLGLERLGAGSAQDRGQLQYRAGHPDAPTTATRAGQRVAGPARAGLACSARRHSTSAAPSSASTSP